MLIGICGGVCAGKHSVQDYLIREHAFTPLTLSSPKGSTVPKNALTFGTVADMVNYATANWQINLVTTSIPDETTAETLSHRPFFLLVHIDAPLSIRYQRYLAKHEIKSPLTDFLTLNDTYLYTPSTSLASLPSRAHLTLLNTAPSLPALYASLKELNLPNMERLRPTWTHYFMTLATLAARRSNCMRRQVGCVLTRNNRVLSTGYNGTPRGVRNCNDGGCARCNSAPSAEPTNNKPTTTTSDPPEANDSHPNGPLPTSSTNTNNPPTTTTNAGGHSLQTCLCLHAEENALLEAGRERVGSQHDAVLYCNTCPCLTCSIKIVQVGIGEVVYNRSYYMDEEAGRIFKEAGVKLTRYEMRGGGSSGGEGLVVLGGGEESGGHGEGEDGVGS